MPLLLVMLGGAIGAGFRFQVGRATLSYFGPGFPWGTFLVNLLGGFLMGLLAGTLVRLSGSGEPLRLFFGVGALGGFTTFSAFSLESYNMLARGDYGTAAAYAVASVVGSILMLSAGIMLARVIA